MRCLEPDPARRPASALAVAAALPGGDPLAAALAAGETPSPEMVAAAGTTEARRHARSSSPIAAWIVVSLVAVVLLYQRVLLVNIVVLPKPPDALAIARRRSSQKLGYGDRTCAPPRAGLGTSLDWARYIDATRPATRTAGRSSTTPRPGDLLLLAPHESRGRWSRSGDENPISGTEPAADVERDDARRRRFRRPAGGVHRGAASRSSRQPRPRRPTDWSPLFDAAGLPMAAFTPAPPRWVPPVYADERKSRGRDSCPNSPRHAVRVEAAAHARTAGVLRRQRARGRIARAAAPAADVALRRASIVADRRHS